MDDSQGTLSLVLFSGTDDKLSSASILTAGAAALGRKVNLFLQYWALENFQKDRIAKDHGVSKDAEPEGASLMRLMREQGSTQHWADTFRQVKEIGDVHLYACALSMEMFGITKDDLDPLIDGVWGVASFMLEADGPVVFI